MKENIVIKAGSECLDPRVREDKIPPLVEDIAEYLSEFRGRTQERIGVILVTSGSVSTGRLLRPDVESQYVLASIGQPALMGYYRCLFENHGLIPAQFLLSHDQIKYNHAIRVQARRTLMDALESGEIVPIINENDTISTYEMRRRRSGTDNDANAIIVSGLVPNVQRVFFLTSTNGVYRNIDDPNTRIPFIRLADLSEDFIHEICGEAKSGSGSGGMASKLRKAKAFLEGEGGGKGRSVHIFNGEDSRLRDHLDLSYGGHGGTVILGRSRKNR